MYLQTTITDKARMQGDGMFRPIFPEADIAKAEKLEIWCSSFSDGGDDFTTFNLVDTVGKVIASRSIGGY